MKKAIVTLAIGKNYELMFERYCRSLWSEYAERHHFDLIVLTKPLDNSPRAFSRSPAWQKCLILSEPSLQQYDRVVWIDSDISIAPNSPDITTDIPLEKIGATDEYSIPTKEEHRRILEKLYNFWSHNNVNYINDLTATAYHQNFGLMGEFESVVQTGVIVLSPRYHRELLEYVYHNYEDKGSAAWHYEMRPLSYEILKQNLAFWLPSKFNMPWVFAKQLFYPFLDSPYSLWEKIGRKLNLDPRASLKSKCVTSAFFNNYFLHFASGTTEDMKYLDRDAKYIF